MRVASICVASALALSFIHSPLLAEVPPPPPPTVSDTNQARNTFIFKFDESVSRGQMPARAREIVAGAGGSLHHVYTNVVGGFAATMPSIAVWGIGGRRDIISFERDEIVTLLAPPWCANSPEHPACGGDDGGDGGELTGQQLPWGVERIDAHNASKTGEGIHVYVIDTGIDLVHPDLAENVGASWDCIGAGQAGVDCKENAGADDQGHGTHVAGTIGALHNDKDVVGVAPGVTLHSVKVLSSTGSGFRSDVIAGIDLVAGQAGASTQPVVANLSLGGGGSKSGSCVGGEYSGPLDTYHEAFCEAADLGVVFVVAAGNDGGDAEKLVPAAYDDVVITVSATHDADDWPKWSNWGDNSAGGLTSLPVAIAAPGVNIVSTQMGGGVTTKSGTSMASPHVAGVAAILIEEGEVSEPDFTADRFNAFVKVRAAILERAAQSFETSVKGKKNPHDEQFVCAVAGC